jgi:hypothetical protein
MPQYTVPEIEIQESEVLEQVVTVGPSIKDVVFILAPQPPLHSATPDS